MQQSCTRSAEGYAADNCVPRHILWGLLWELIPVIRRAVQCSFRSAVQSRGPFEHRIAGCRCLPHLRVALDASDDWERFFGDFRHDMFIQCRSAGINLQRSISGFDRYDEHHHGRHTVSLGCGRGRRSEGCATAHEASQVPVTTQSPGGTTTVTNTFDGQGRITQTVSTAGWTATYSAWDSAGRPTVAVEVGPGLNNTRTMRYDDAARTRGTTSANVATLETFDANGNIVGYSTTAGGTAVSTMTSTTHATDRICK